jgi:O-antigen ligase
MVAGLIGIGLWILPDNISESILVRLSVIGYPNGGVIQYIEQNPDLAERAIGTSVEPNALGGLLALAGTLAVSLVLARKTTHNAWFLYLSIALMSVCLILTFGRGAMLAFGIGLLIIAIARSRKFLWILLVSIGILLISPWSQVYIERFISGFQGQDLATQMRFGEYKDALTLIGRYPLIGVGFTGAPDIDIYLGVSNMYLTIASNMGLLGLTTFCVLIFSVLVYAWQSTRGADVILIGLIAVLIEILVIGIFDHYFFNIEFHHMSTLLWMYVGVLLATARIIRSSRHTA